MDAVEIRDPGDARRFFAQGLWLQRAARPSAATVAPALRWAAELASGGDPLPPIGFVADAGNLALDGGRDPSPGRAFPEVPGWPAGLTRAYEDLVLGRLDADASMARASAALARYRGRDRARGLAFLLDALRRRAGSGGALINPAVLKAAREVPADVLLAEGWESLAREGPMPILADLYGRLVAGVREMPEALGPEDLFELESRTALMAFADRVAIRQVIRAAAEFEAGAPDDRPRPTARRHDVATRLLDEDAYPVGGFSSISTRGSIESLLHSQLVYMEDGERPDLFDIKFARDELLYYARDENEFFRRRLVFPVVLEPGLALARVKDSGSPYQRIVLLLALLVAAVRRLSRWMSAEAITFVFLFLRDGGAEPLAPERSLLEMALREMIANGMVVSDVITEGELASRYAAMSRRASGRGLVVTFADRRLEPRDFPTAILRLGGDLPSLVGGGGPADLAGTGESSAAWPAVLEGLLEFWATDGPVRHP